MFEQPYGALAVIGIAIVIAVDEVRPDFSQVACSNWLIAHQTEGLRTGRPAIHHDESHVTPPVGLVTLGFCLFGRDRGHVVTCNRLFRLAETRRIETDGSIVRGYAYDIEWDRRSYTEVCGVSRGGRFLGRQRRAPTQIHWTKQSALSAGRGQNASLYRASARGLP
jgi:hypothetical protein